LFPEKSDDTSEVHRTVIAHNSHQSNYVECASTILQKILTI